jgi:hypothetical protein
MTPPKGSRPSSDRNAIKYLVVTIVILFVLARIFDKPSPSAGPAEGRRPAEGRKNAEIGGRGITRGGFPACTTEAEFDQLSAMIDSRDAKAAAKYVEETAGRCILLKAGIPVVVQDYVRLGVVRLRPVGETVTMVTNIEAAAPQ